jgi:REP element-mobilizing transposase RayT
MNTVGSPNDAPVAYLLTFRTYGTWLPDEQRGSVTKKSNHYGTPVQAGLYRFERVSRRNMRFPRFLLTKGMRLVLREAVPEFCKRRSVELRALHVGQNHVHLVIEASGKPEQLLNWVKAKSTSRLKEQGLVGQTQKVWARHGSTRYLWNEDQSRTAAQYVLTGQELVPSKLDPREKRFKPHRST